MRRLIGRGYPKYVQPSAKPENTEQHTHAPYIVQISHRVISQTRFQAHRFQLTVRIPSNSSVITLIYDEYSPGSYALTPGSADRITYSVVHDAFETVPLPAGLLREAIEYIMERVNPGTTTLPDLMEELGRQRLM